MLFRVAMLLAWLCASPVMPALAAERIAVDMELLIAVDVSHSITADEHRLQTAGIAAAFRSPALIEAIAARGQGRIAVAVMYWADEQQQLLAVPWQLVNDAESAGRFADLVQQNDSKPWPGLVYTAIGSALLRGADAIDGNGFDGQRRVIDMSADDPSNRGVPADQARDRIVARGIVVNGLPILSNRHEMSEKEALVQHFERDVSGGEGAFVLPAESFRDVPRAILSKLITEVAMRPGVTPNVASIAAGFAPQ